MGDQTSEAWFVQIEAKILDAFFFVNPENRRGYLEYICGSYEPKDRMSSLRDELKTLNNRLNEVNPGASDWRSNMFVQVDEIVKVWGELRINEENRTDFQTPILREFADKMNEIDSLIFDGAEKENLLQLFQVDSSNFKIAEGVQKISGLLDEAIKLWGEFQEKI